MISCPICRGTETHKMDCQNATYVERLQAEVERLKGDMQRIYDNCSDIDMVIDIAAAALEDK